MNLAGKTVVPGLADLHAHVGGLSNARWSLKLLLAHGITTVFDPSSSLGHIAAVKRWVATEEAVPHFYAANTALQGSYTEQQFLQPGNEVATKVEDFASFGVDFIKVYNFLSSAALVQVGELSRKYGIPVTGHTPLSWTSVGSIDAGIKILQHIRVRPYEVIDDLEIVARYPVDGALMKRTAFWAHARPDARTLNQTLDLWAKRKEKFFVTPTLVVQEAIAESYDYPDARFEKTPGLTLISPALLARFKKGSPPVHWGKLSPAEIAEAKKSTDGMAMFVRLAHQRGIRILAGTDMPVPWLVPGISLHRELQHFVEKVAMTPVEAIRSATGRVSEALEVPDRGTIKPGQIADLVIVGGPVANDITALSNVEVVILGGRSYTRAQLLEEAARLAAQDTPES